MAIQDVKCANCGKYLSPVWREKCLHCGVPMAIARPAMIPTPMTMAGQRPVRVQSVLRGPNEAACLQQAVVDGQRAAANGYAPVWQTWGREGADVTLTILYDLVQAAPSPPPPPVSALPPLAPAPMPPPAPAPVQVSQSWPAPPAAPAPVVTQPVAWAPPPVPQVIVQAPPSPAPAAPAPAASNPSIANRVFGAIISILVVVVVYWIVAAGERAIF